MRPRPNHPNRRQGQLLSNGIFEVSDITNDEVENFPVSINPSLLTTLVGTPGVEDDDINA